MNEQDHRARRQTNIAALRREYSGRRLTPLTSPKSPFVLFAEWFEQALEVCEEPSAMVLSTVGADGSPSSRVVLLKGVDESGFVFFTNYRSRKGKELETQPLAALNFFWPTLHRQVRLEGLVSRISADASDKYFESRPRDSQLGAWASPQSEEINGREVLEAALAVHTRKFDGLTDVPRPVHWGGLRLVPGRFEFWQGQPDRLHDRIVYLSTDHSAGPCKAAPCGDWSLKCLAP